MGGKKGKNKYNPAHLDEAGLWRVSWRSESNRRPTPYKGVALPIELRQREAWIPFPVIREWTLSKSILPQGLQRLQFRPQRDPVIRSHWLLRFSK